MVYIYGIVTPSSSAAQSSYEAVDIGDGHVAGEQKMLLPALRPNEWKKLKYRKCQCPLGNMQVIGLTYVLLYHTRYQVSPDMFLQINILLSLLLYYTWYGMHR